MILLASLSLTLLISRLSAAVVSPVERVGYQGSDIHIPTGPAGVGLVAEAMLQRITDIQLGNMEHEWSVVIDEKI